MSDDRQALFDEWAAEYGIAAGQASRFPFLGYHDVLSQVAGRVAESEPGRVIELGAGTGTLTSLLRGLLPNAELVAVDVSSEMLTRIERLDIGVQAVQADLAAGALPDVPSADVVTGTYLLYKLTDARKVDLLGDLADHNLKPGGRIVIGDVGFCDAQVRDAAAERWAEHWDPNEHYLAVHELSGRVTSANLELTDAFYPSDCACVIELVRDHPGRSARTG